MYTISAAIFSVFLTLPIPQIDAADAGVAPLRLAQAEQPARNVEPQRIPAFWIVLPD